jgi:hypothetical protein
MVKNVDIGGGGGTGKGGKKPVSPQTSEWTKYLDAEAVQESGGNWTAVSPDNALGRWQVEQANLYGWAKQARLPPVSKDYFLAHPAYQTELVTAILKPQFDAHGPAEAAAWWYSGQYDASATFGDPPVYEYVQSVLHLMGESDIASQIGVSVSGSAFGLGSVPAPGNDSWAGSVGETATYMKRISSSMGGHSSLIRQYTGTREDY